MPANRKSDQAMTGTSTAVPDAFVKQLDLLCRTQQAVLASWQAATDEWFKHRQAHVAAAQAACDELLQCRDLGQVATVQQKWLAGVMDRASSDFQCCADSAMALSREAVAREGELGLDAFPRAAAE